MKICIRAHHLPLIPSSLCASRSAVDIRDVAWSDWSRRLGFLDRLFDDCEQTFIGNAAIEIVNLECRIVCRRGQRRRCPSPLSQGLDRAFAVLTDEPIRLDQRLDGPFNLVGAFFDFTRARTQSHEWKAEQLVGSRQYVEAHLTPFLIPRRRDHRDFHHTFLESSQTARSRSQCDKLDFLLGVDAEMLEHHDRRDLVRGTVRLNAQGLAF